MKKALSVFTVFAIMLSFINFPSKTKISALDLAKYINFYPTSIGDSTKGWVNIGGNQSLDVIDGKLVVVPSGIGGMYYGPASEYGGAGNGKVYNGILSFKYAVDFKPGANDWGSTIQFRVNSANPPWAITSGFYILIKPDKVVLYKAGGVILDVLYKFLVNQAEYAFNISYIDNVSGNCDVEITIKDSNGLLIKNEGSATGCSLKADNVSGSTSAGYITVYGNSTQINKFIVSPGLLDPSSANRTAKIYGTDSDGDKIIANINVKEYPYLAKGDGYQDDTNAIQEALYDIGNAGGGIVYIPRGKYVIGGNITIPKNTVLRGEWNAPDKGGSGRGTILMAYADRGNETGNSFISMGVASCLKNISVWYPEQTANNIQSYPWTIGLDGVSCYLEGITLYNSYNGINTHKINGSAQHIYKVYGTPIKTGISFDINLEVSECSTVRFSTDIWANSGLANAPTGLEIENIRTYTRSAVGIECGRIDDVWLYDIGINPYDYPTGVKFLWGDGNGNVNLAGGTYGHIMKLHDTQIYIEDLSDFNVNLDIVDDIPSVLTPTYAYAKPRCVESDTIISVTDTLFGAVGDGEIDDTLAFENALLALSSLGGTVFVPAGKYKITRALIIPTGVELRGVYEGPHSCMGASVSELNVYTGSGSIEGAAFLTLQSYSGIQGLTISYPEQLPSSIVPYPFTIKGNGENIWIEATTLLNSFLGVDFNSVKCDNFLLKNVWGTVLNDAFVIGGGSDNGRIENCLVSYGVWYETSGLASNPEDVTALKSYYSQNSVMLVLGDTQNLTCWSLFSFYCNKGVSTFIQNNNVPKNITFYRLGIDSPIGNCGMEISYGDNIRAYAVSIGMQSGGTGVKTASTLEGPLYIYGLNSWGGFTNSISNPQVVTVFSSLDPYVSSKNIATIPAQNRSGNKWGTHQPNLVSISDSTVSLNENMGAQTSLYSVDQYTSSTKADLSATFTSFSLSAIDTGTTDWNILIALRDNNITTAVWAPETNAIILLVKPTCVVLMRMENTVQKEAVVLYKSFVDGIDHTYDVHINDETGTVTVVIDKDDLNMLQINCAAMPSHGGTNIMAMKTNAELSGFISMEAKQLIDFGTYEKSDKNLITKILAGTITSEIKSVINPAIGIDILLSDTNSAELSNQDILGTNSTIKAYMGSTLINTFAIIIYGDVDGNGYINLLDLANIKRHLLKIETLDNHFFTAGDIYRKGSIAISDLLAVKKQLLNLANIIQ